MAEEICLTQKKYNQNSGTWVRRLKVKGKERKVKERKVKERKVKERKRTEKKNLRTEKETKKNK